VPYRYFIFNRLTLVSVSVVAKALVRNAKHQSKPLRQPKHPNKHNQQLRLHHLQPQLAING
jgi:hypothetical protein